MNESSALDVLLLLGVDLDDVALVIESSRGISGLVSALAYKIMFF